VVYDGTSSLRQLDFADHPLHQHGGELVLEPHPAGRGTRFHARVHTTDDLPIPAGEHRMVSSA
jgi:hypothetical protein